MILLTLIFKLGVRFAIFNFIWFFLELVHKMLTGMRPPFLAEHYILKALKYIFLVSITFSYCLEFAPNEPVYVLNWQKLVPGGLILMLYLLDIIGTMAFAISGVLTAFHKKLDPFGVFIIAFVTLLVITIITKKIKIISNRRKSKKNKI